MASVALEAGTNELRQLSVAAEAGATGNVSGHSLSKQSDWGRRKSITGRMTTITLEYEPLISPGMASWKEAFGVVESHMSFSHVPMVWSAQVGWSSIGLPRGSTGGAPAAMLHCGTGGWHILAGLYAGWDWRNAECDGG